jgi:hypothetical protein
MAVPVLATCFETARLHYLIRIMPNNLETLRTTNQSSRVTMFGRTVHRHLFADAACNQFIAVVQTPVHDFDMRSAAGEPHFWIVTVQPHPRTRLTLSEASSSVWQPRIRSEMAFILGRGRLRPAGPASDSAYLTEACCCERTGISFIAYFHSFFFARSLNAAFQSFLTALTASHSFVGSATFPHLLPNHTHYRHNGTLIHPLFRPSGASCRRPNFFAFHG